MNSNPASPHNPPSSLTAQGTFGFASSCHWLGAHTASAVSAAVGSTSSCVSRLAEAKPTAVRTPAAVSVDSPL